MTKQIIEKELFLKNLISYIDMQLKNFREGSLKTTTCKGTTQYYWRNSGKKSGVNGVYISKSNLELAKELAQKDYLIKLRKEAYKLLKCVQAFREDYHESKLFELYDAMAPARQKLVKPLLLDDEEYGTIWQNKSFTTLGGFAKDWFLKSNKGECMRSKSEIMIANLLAENNIPYRYEPQIVLADGTTVYPDFQVLNKRTRKEYYWEHLGMLSDLDYTDKFIKKNDTYAKNNIIQGIHLIYSYETSDRRMDTEAFQVYINEFLL